MLKINSLISVLTILQIRHLNAEKQYLRTIDNSRTDPQNNPPILLLLLKNPYLRSEVNNQTENVQKLLEPYRSYSEPTEPLLTMTKVTDSESNERLGSRRWRGSCDKKAAKACRSACISAIKSLCSTYYSCARRFKRRSKMECRRSCNSKFKSNSYSDTE